MILFKVSKEKGDNSKLLSNRDLNSHNHYATTDDAS